MGNSKKHRILVGYRVHIFQRGKGRTYQAEFHYRGQHRVRTLKTDNLKVATQRAIKLALQIQEGTLDVDQVLQPVVAASQVMLDSAVDAYIAYLTDAGNRPSTLKKYRGTLAGFVAFSGTKKVCRIDQVTLSLIDAYMAHRSKQSVRGRKTGKVQKYHDLSLLKRFLQWCADRQMIGANPLERQKVSRPPTHRREECLTLAQVDRILSALPARMQGPVAVLAFGGMRSANCSQLLVDDIDLQGGWIHVRSREGATTKMGNEWKVPIHSRLKAILEALPRPSRGYFFTVAPSRKFPDGGHWVNMRHLNDDFVATLKKLGIPAGRDKGFTIHSLRHFFKSICIGHGVPREYVDAWQGHASIRSASDLYVHTFDVESQRLMKQVPFGDGISAPDAEQ
jgi:integrase